MQALAVRPRLQFAVVAAFVLTAESAVLASRRGGVEPMDRAIVRLGDALLDGTHRLHPEWRLAHEYPLTPELLATSHVWLAAGDAGVLDGSDARNAA